MDRKLGELLETLLIVGSVVGIVWALFIYTPTDSPGQPVRVCTEQPAASTGSHAPMTAKEWTPEIAWDNPEWTKK